MAARVQPGRKPPTIMMQRSRRCGGRPDHVRAFVTGRRKTECVPLWSPFAATFVLLFQSFSSCGQIARSPLSPRPPPLVSGEVELATEATVVVVLMVVVAVAVTVVAVTVTVVAVTVTVVAGVVRPHLRHHAASHLPLPRPAAPHGRLPSTTHGRRIPPRERGSRRRAHSKSSGLKTSSVAAAPTTLTESQDT